MTTVKLKLLVDKSSTRVVYAECGKEFVDLLLGLMEMPLGSILHLFKRQGKIGSLSLGNIYLSADDLEDSYLQQSDVRKSILTPSSFDSDSKVKQTAVLKNLVSSSSYSCSYSESRKTIEGYVKGAVTYMIMDDLTIKPSSTITSINLFVSLGIKDMGNLQEKVVQVNSQKALELVRAAFQSSTVLTDVFIGNDQRVDTSTT